VNGWRSFPTVDGVCGKCGVPYAKNRSHIGKEVACSECGHRFLLQDSSSSTPGSEAAIPAPPVDRPPQSGPPVEKTLLNCTQCGGSLEVVENQDLVKCRYCESLYAVERKGDSVRIVELERRVKKVEKKQDNLNDRQHCLEILMDLKPRLKVVEEEYAVVAGKSPLVTGCSIAVILFIFSLCIIGAAIGAKDPNSNTVVLVVALALGIGLPTVLKVIHKFRLDDVTSRLKSIEEKVDYYESRLRE
jgi:DNA-directed RNA polymerase subunit RPC12/RpoP